MQSPGLRWGLPEDPARRVRRRQNHHSPYGLGRALRPPSVASPEKSRVSWCENQPRPRPWPSRGREGGRRGPRRQPPGLSLLSPSSSARWAGPTACSAHTCLAGLHPACRGSRPRCKGAPLCPGQGAPQESLPGLGSGQHVGKRQPSPPRHGAVTGSHGVSPAWAQIPGVRTPSPRPAVPPTPVCWGSRWIPGGTWSRWGLWPSHWASGPHTAAPGAGEGRVRMGCGARARGGAEGPGRRAEECVEGGPLGLVSASPICTSSGSASLSSERECRLRPSTRGPGQAAAPWLGVWAAATWDQPARPSCPASGGTPPPNTGPRSFSAPCHRGWRSR